MAAAEGAVFPVLCPATGATIATVADCTAQDAVRAVDAADAAQASWSRSPVSERVAVLRRLSAELLTRRASIAALLTKENGKPLAEATGEVGFAASFFDWFAEEARRSYGDTIPSPSPSKRMLTVRQPVGVTALITPWNFPIGMIGRKVAAALAAGCTCVIKPAEDTPLVALAFAQVVEACGVPQGVVNVVPCSRANAPAVGAIFCSAPSVRMLSFTGSSDVGKVLAERCGAALKRVALELGGDAPFVVFPSADMARAVQGAMDSKFRNTGQTCVTANRFLVQRAVVAPFIRGLREAMAGLVMGDGMKGGVTQGPLINSRQHARLCRIVSLSVQQGAKVLVGGTPGEGLFYPPTILVDVTPDMPVVKEEIFGPVVAIMEFDTEEEALQLANATDKGLAGFFFTSDLNQAIRVSERMEVGMVGVNEGLVSTCEAPFGGVKHSGVGKEGSRHGLDEYTNIKYICIGGQ